jgi:hypothetical protein
MAMPADLVTRIYNFVPETQTLTPIENKSLYSDQDAFWPIFRVRITTPQNLPPEALREAILQVGNYAAITALKSATYNDEHGLMTRKLDCRAHDTYQALHEQTRKAMRAFPYKYDTRMPTDQLRMDYTRIGQIASAVVPPLRRFVASNKPRG